MIYLVNYANNAYRKAQIKNTKTGLAKCKFDDFFEFKPEDIEFEYRSKHNDIFSVKRGDGLWLWKPYFINKVLNQVNNGDYIFYCDSGAYFIGNIKPLIDSMKEDIWVSGLPLIEKQYTKKSCLVYMNCYNDYYTESNQVSATFLLIKCSDFSKKFVKEWLTLCENYDLISPSNNLYDCEDSCFISHREDQSILSLLAKKYKLTIHKDPSQYGKLPEKYKGENRIYKKLVSEDKYNPIIIHHRTKDCNKIICIKQYLNVLFPRWLGKIFIK